MVDEMSDPATDPILYEKFDRPPRRLGLKIHGHTKTATPTHTKNGGRRDKKTRGARDIRQNKKSNK